MSVRCTDVAVHAVPQLTLQTSARATELALFSRDLGGSVTHVVVAAMGRALLAHPEACVVVSNHEGSAAVVPVTAAVGVAIPTQSDLLVPVVRNAARAPLPAVKAEVERVVSAARAGRLAAEDSGGAPTTVSCLEMGLGMFPPIVNPPQASTFVVEPGPCPDTVSLTLSIDSRALTLEQAALYLDTLIRLLEQPYRRLV